ncbi:MAG: DnaJ domain-containing protein [Hahellaceae bacterium]|nr:DnaJ domain-containing protein [Hahellaceae bacterium]
MIRLIFLITLFTVVFWFWTTWKNADPKKRKQLYVKAAFVFFIGTLLILVVTGRLHVLFAAIAAVIPYLGRLYPLLKQMPLLKRLWSNRLLFTGGAAETSLLTMARDRSSGKLSGDVIQGSAAGRSLDSLDKNALAALYQEARTSSPESILLLQAYFEQRFGEGWRSIFDFYSQTAASSSGMSVSEAYDVLGLPEGTSLQQVLEAHRRLIQKLHPDRGGSNFLAAQINLAKDVLSKHLA